MTEQKQTYNIDAIKTKMDKLLGKQSKKEEKKELPKFKWFKPKVNKTYEVRFLPLTDKDGLALQEPFFEIAYYDNKEILKNRFVAPSQFGMPDPFKELAMELATSKTKEAWFTRKKVTPKERYYAAMVVRGGTSDLSGDASSAKEDEVIIWELSPKLCKEVYAALVHPDYAEEDLFDIDKGYDFTVTVTPTDKVFEGYPVKEIKLQPRRKASKLGDKKFVETVLAQRPNFHEYFSSQVFAEDKLLELRENFLNPSSPEGEEERGSDSNEDALAALNEQFASLD